MGPGHVTEGPEQDLEAAQLRGQERVAAGVGDLVVEPAIDGPRPLDKARGGLVVVDQQLFEIGSQRMQPSQLDAATSQADGGAFQDFADLADFLHLPGRDAAHDCPAVG